MSHINVFITTLPHPSFSRNVQVEWLHFWKSTVAHLLCHIHNGWCYKVKLVSTELMDTTAVTEFCPMPPFCSPDHYTSLYPQTSYLGTDTLCLCKLKRVLCWATHMCVGVFVCLLVDLCVPISSSCITSRKSEEKQPRTLCKHPVTKLLESPSNSVFTLLIMFSADNVVFNEGGVLWVRVLSPWYLNHCLQ